MLVIKGHAMNARSDTIINRQQIADAGREHMTGQSQNAALGLSARLLVLTSWISGAIFAAYIVGFFGGSALGGAGRRWNESLPDLYDGRAWLTTAAIGTHFMAGGVLLLLGPIQLFERVRRNLPRLHRWLGRVYVLSAGLGGLAFILGRGTVGGSLMDVGFGIYGTLMVLCAFMAYIHARAGHYQQHRVWAIRLFALTVGSWLYRMEYGAWHVLTGGLGIESGFSGWFDAIMMFFFYIPNLLIAELFIRARQREHHPVASLAAAAVLLVSSAFIIFATWTFTTRNWGPRMISGVSEISR